MKPLLVLRDTDVFPDKNISLPSTWKERRTGKVILLNNNQQIALVGNKVHSYFLLPGGGIEDFEDVREGTIRECREETGCIVELTNELGMTEDFRARDSKHCITWGYIGNIISCTSPHLTTEEIDVGMYIKWLPYAEAVQVFEFQEQELRAGNIDFYNTGFNILRDKFFLKCAAPFISP